MVETLVKASEVERFITPIFGNREIAVSVVGQTVILTACARFNGKSVSNELYGILKGAERRKIPCE